MNLTAAFVAHEWRMQLRSSRYRLMGGLYVAAVSAAPVLLAFFPTRADQEFGPATYAEQLFYLQPFLTVILAAGLSFDGILREQREGSWQVLGLTAISNSGYLLRRWLALVTVLLPLTCLPPVLALAGAWSTGEGPVALAPFFWPWLLYVVPLGLAFSALSLALGTVVGSSLGALIVFFLGKVVLGGWIASLLKHLLIRWDGFGDWLGLEDFAWGVSLLGWRLGGSPPGTVWSYGIPSSEGPFESRLLASQLAAEGALWFALYGVLLAAAAFFVRRTVADVPPRPVPAQHPLRGFLKAWQGWRQRGRPEPKPTRADFLALGMAVLLLTAVVGWQTARFDDYLRLGEECYQAEIAEGPLPTPLNLSVEDYRLEGRLEGDGSLAAEVQLTLHNKDSVPQGRLAFSLNSGLDVQADTASVALERRWDRLEIRLVPPLSPGERRAISLRLDGRPEEHFFYLPYGGLSHVQNWEFFRAARFVHDLTDLSRSSTRRKITAGRIALVAEDLLPVPRYSSWKLTPPPTMPGTSGREVPPEVIFQRARFELDLEGPAGALLASSCGDLAEPEGRGRAHLQSSCVQGIDQLAVYGGDYRLVGPAPVEGEPGVAVFRGHEGRARLHLPALLEAGRMVESAWPPPSGTEVGGDAESRLVFFEDLPHFSTNLGRKIRLWEESDLRFSPLRSFGQLVLIPEYTLARVETIEPESLLARLTAQRLGQRRLLEPKDEPLLTVVFEHLVLHRLGLLENDAAVISNLGPFKTTLVSSPILGIDGYQLRYGNLATRLGALLNYLLWRIGPETAYAAVDEFLDRSRPGKGTFSELLGLLESRSGLSLARFHEDFLAGVALPEVGLEEVEFRRRGASWQVTGRMVNRGTGRVICPLVLTTQLSPEEQTVEVGGGEEVPFSLETPYSPQAVVVDPRRRCFRYEDRAVTVRVENRG